MASDRLDFVIRKPGGSVYLYDSRCNGSSPRANGSWDCVFFLPASSRLAPRRRLWMLTWRHGQTPGYGENGGGSAMDDPEEFGDVMSRDHRWNTEVVSTVQSLSTISTLWYSSICSPLPQIFGGGDLCGTHSCTFLLFSFPAKDLARSCTS